MKSYLIFVFSFLPILLFSQVKDSILPPPEIEVQLPQIIKDSQVVDLDWAINILKNTDKIFLTQLRPYCEDGELRETIPPNSQNQPKDCYTESVIISDLKFIPEVDSLFLSEAVVRFDTTRMYRWSELDSADYKSVIEASLGKRNSDILNMCYDPRHAIIYLDSSSKILGIYEVCFECSNAKIAFDHVHSISIYKDDYKTLKSLFRRYKYLE